MTKLTSIPARPTTYKGERMRSRLEAGFAAWLDSERISWEYEPECFASEQGQYLPDFRLVDVPGDYGSNGDRGPFYVEIKPAMAGAQVITDACRRMEVVWASHPNATLAVMGPHDLCFWGFPITVGQRWGVGAWTQCHFGCELLAIDAYDRSTSVDWTSQHCPDCFADGPTLVSPWAGIPYWMAPPPRPDEPVVPVVGARLALGGVRKRSE